MGEQNVRLEFPEDNSRYDDLDIPALTEAEMTDFIQRLNSGPRGQPREQIIAEFER